MRQLLLTAVLFGLATSANSAPISVSPAAPKAMDTVVVHADVRDLPSAWGTPDVAMFGGKITVTLHEAAILVEGPNPDLDWPIGKLPAGSYEVEVVMLSGGSQTSIGTTSVQVAPRPNSGPKADYSDMWLAPNESGWGVSIQQHPSDVLFITWFVYDSNRKPTWYVVPNGQWQSDHQFTGTVYKTTGPYFGGAFDPTTVTVQTAGTVILQFRSFQTLVFSYSVEGVTGQKTLVRQSF